MKLHENSLFAILLRSQWWVSALIAAGVFGVLRLFLDVGFAAFAAAPFVVIALYVGFKQLRRPGTKRIAATLERARALPWDGFCTALEEGFKREGFTASRMMEGGADLVLRQQGLVTLVACKRWKAMRTGIEPLREFEAATRERGAHARLYVAAGEVTDNARAFALEKKIRLLEEADLVKLLGALR